MTGLPGILPFWLDSGHSFFSEESGCFCFFYSGKWRVAILNEDGKNSPSLVWEMNCH